VEVLHGLARVDGEKYDIFSEKVLKVKDVAVLTSADLVQRLLVDYIDHTSVTRRARLLKEIAKQKK
jgi:hypothetical protein